MTYREAEYIQNNLKSFIHNFGEVSIEKADPRTGGYFVHYPVNDPVWNIYCENLDYLNGWLYGAVQGVRCIEPTRVKYNIKNDMNG